MFIGVLEAGPENWTRPGHCLDTVFRPGGIGKDIATPAIQVDPQTYEVFADGQLLTCEPAQVLPMAQRYFLF